MKYLIFSDLHGSASMAKFIVEKYKEENCDSLICLGDVLYHGPRNDLPKNYAPKEVVELLNPLASKILCIQGNCDAEVDQMVLSFDLLKSKDMIIHDKKCHLEHGHHLDINDPYPVDVVLYGHTHIPVLEVIGNVLYINPGSITLPKGGNPSSYIIWNENKITLYDTFGTILKDIFI